MSAESISDWLADQRDAAPDELQGLILEFEDLWERKLWHQLTDKLVEFFDSDASQTQRLAFFKVFITKFADKINQLKLVGLALKAAETCKDNKEKLSFLETVAKKVDGEDSQDAFVYATTAVARVRLGLKDFDGARKDLDKVEKILDRFDSVESIVHAAFYDTNATYYQEKREFASYYRNALLYLACIDLDKLSEKERRDRAYRLSIAALVSTSIYNFGELLLHPILESLRADKENKWLPDLLLAFNRGSLKEFQALAGHITSHTLLSEYSDLLKQKIHLAALTEAVFNRPPHDRTMTFDAIAKETRLSKDEIEHLVMKALSEGLIRGTIDQVDEVVHITWVQPKVLGKGQIENMCSRLKEWDSNVNNLGHFIEKVGQDVWAA